ncbi:hypothetical protein Q1695_003109 [Nippostrongylus brasiliensis]|nr:hypothetical protein Q1695_003109 [Nippostrongylus brasiliensis]
MEGLSYDCELETLAQQQLDKDCLQPPAANPSKAQIHSQGQYTPGVINGFIASALSAWEVLEENPGFDPNAITTSGVVYVGSILMQPVAQILSSRLTGFGCSAKNCSGPGSVVCIFNGPEVKMGEMVYDAGSGPCTSSTGCDLHSPSECNVTSGLCQILIQSTVAPTGTVTSASTASGSSTSVSTASPSTSPSTTLSGGGGAGVTMGASAAQTTRCPNNRGMRDTFRFLFRDMHNYRRGLLARGEIAKNNGNRLPKGANMMFLRYNCQLETQAMQYASQCPSSKSGVAGENFAVVNSNIQTTWKAQIEEAVRSWWRVVRKHPGVGMKVTFRQHHVGTPIESFTQMGWAATRRFGCAIVRCPAGAVAVCRYRPAGNVVGQVLYAVGNPCTRCPAGATCTDGLCTLP